MDIIYIISIFFTFLPTIVKVIKCLNCILRR